MRKKAISIAMVGLTLSGILIPLTPVGTQKAEAAVPAAYYSPSGLALSKQTKIIPVSGQGLATPSIYWTQLDDGRFQAGGENGLPAVIANMAGSNDEPYPAHDASADYSVELNMKDVSAYNAKGFYDSSGTKEYPNSAIDESTRQLAPGGVTFSDQTVLLGYIIPGYESITVFNNNEYARFRVRTGGEANRDQNETRPLTEINKRPNGFYKWLVKYPFTLDIIWTGEVHQTKILAASTAKPTMNVGDTSASTATIETKDYLANAPVNVNSQPGTTVWSSDNSAVASVDPNTGLITAKSNGTAKLTVKWIPQAGTASYGYQIYQQFTVTVGGGGGHEDPPPPSNDCTQPTPEQALEAQVMDSSASAVIKADIRGGEKFNVLDGIPTSESLYGNVLAKNYLYHNKFVKMAGKCTIQVNVQRSYNLTWDPGKEVTDEQGVTHTEPDPQSATEQLTKTYSIERPYSYWVVDQLQVYQIKQAALQNYAFDSGSILIEPSGYSPPAYSVSKSGGFSSPDNPGTVEAPGGSKAGGKDKPDISGEDLKSFAEQAIGKVKVNNDTFSFNGSVVMDGNEREQTTAAPGQIALPTQISSDVLYSPGHVISASKVNKQAQPSTGTISYLLMNGGIGGGENEQQFTISGINPVTVHTPVVMYPQITDDKAHNQRTLPDLSRAALILDRPFTVTLPTSGQHNNYLGYGNRDYIRYTAYKQVKFEFDVYTEDRSMYIPANTWINVPVNQPTAIFIMPVWVDEGPYTVYFRSIAENAPNGYTSGQEANMQLQDHAAVNSLPADVIGRLYDFRVTDVLDYNWERVFRTGLGQKLASRAAYWVGFLGIDGDPRGNVWPYKLPIYPGSHPDSAFRNVAVKTGYTFRFDFKTKGNLFAGQDEIHITPSFDYISEDGAARFPVDLYYHSGEQKFIKIGSAEDQVERTVILNDPYRNVPENELIDTALYRYDHDYAFNEVAGLSREAFVARFINVLAKRPIAIGTYHSLFLNEDVRTLIGPKTGIPAGVDPQRAIAAEQKWYGEYSLPSGVYAVKQGTNLAEYGRTHGGLTDRSDIFIRKGYLVVNFDLETVPDGDGSRPKLQYIHAPLMNQWQLEGAAKTVEDSVGHLFHLRDGDVLFYEAGLSSRDDFRPLVTH